MTAEGKDGGRKGRRNCAPGEMGSQAGYSEVYNARYLSCQVVWILHSSAPDWRASLLRLLAEASRRSELKFLRSGPVIVRLLSQRWEFCYSWWVSGFATRSRRPGPRKPQYQLLQRRRVRESTPPKECRNERPSFIKRKVSRPLGCGKGRVFPVFM